VTLILGLDDTVVDIELLFDGIDDSVFCSDSVGFDEDETDDDILFVYVSNDCVGVCD
jgi:hypothetical protein